MPEMTGIELAETIYTTCPALPVVLVTGYGNREALKDLGEARILKSKPHVQRADRLACACEPFCAFRVRNYHSAWRYGLAAPSSSPEAGGALMMVPGLEAQLVRDETWVQDVRAYVDVPSVPNFAGGGTIVEIS